MTTSKKIPCCSALSENRTPAKKSSVRALWAFQSVRTAARFLCGSLTIAALAHSSDASASGLYFGDRGVRPIGRGGAFVAGADDLGAIYYNPAGIVDAKSQILFDASWLSFSSTFQRQVQVTGSDPNTGATTASAVRTYSKVEGSTPVLPIPTLAASYAIRPDVVVAMGMYAPYAALTSYPSTVNGGPAPQRYSLITLDGSLLSVIGAWVSWRPAPQIQFGVGPNLLVGTFQSSVVFGACVPDKFVCAPEQKEFDAAGQLSVGNIIAPSANFGVIATPADMLRLGLAFQLGYHVDSDATLKTRLPTSAFFDKARVEGESANVKFDLPWIFRAGAEIRPQRDLRAEVAFVFEKWSVHDRIDVVPDNTNIRNVALIGDYHVGALSIDRGFKDSWSIRFGAEKSLAVSTYKIDLRAGLAYEKSAVPKEKLSVLTVDLDKVTLGLGSGLHIKERWRLDGTLAFIFGSDQEVKPEEAKIYKVNPMRARTPEGSEIPINAGIYTAKAIVLGAGLRYLFE